MTQSIQVLENGDLEFTIADVSFSDYRQLIEIKNEYPYEQHAFEVFTEREYYALPDNEYLELGLLTEAPILSDNDYWADEEARSEDFNLWYFANYMLENAFETLIREKRVVFTSAQK